MQPIKLLHGDGFRGSDSVKAASHRALSHTNWSKHDTGQCHCQLAAMATDSVGTNRRNGTTTCTMALTGSMQYSRPRPAGILAQTPRAERGLVQFTKGLMNPILAQLTDCTDTGAGCLCVLSGSPYMEDGFVWTSLVSVPASVCLRQATTIITGDCVCLWQVSLEVPASVCLCQVSIHVAVSVYDRHLHLFVYDRYHYRWLHLFVYNSC